MAHSEGFSRHIRRLRPSDPSFECDTRPRRTHADPNVAAAYAKLPLKEKLEINKQFRDNNAKRCVRATDKAIAHANHAAAIANTLPNGPVPVRAPEADEDISDVESDITIDEEIFDNIRTSPELFQEFRHLLDHHTIATMQQLNRKEEFRRLDPVTTKDTTLLLSDLEPDMQLIIPNSTERTKVIFPDMFKLTVKLGFSYPLAFFVPDTLDLIISKIHVLKKCRVEHKSKKFSILDIDNISRKLKDEKGAGPLVDSELSHFQWVKASQIHYFFEIERYGDPDAACPSFFKNHYGFFKNQKDSEKLFSIWSPHEIKLRRRHYGHNEGFSASNYQAVWTRILSAYDAHTIMLEARNATSHFSTPPSASSLGSSATPKNCSSNPASLKPFPTSTQSSLPEPRCLGCGRKGHRLGDKGVDHGPFPFCDYTGSALFAKSGAYAGQKVCVPFQRRYLLFLQLLL